VLLRNMGAIASRSKSIVMGNLGSRESETPTLI
jgi:hypothetical protein